MVTASMVSAKVVHIFPDDGVLVEYLGPYDIVVFEEDITTTVRLGVKVPTTILLRSNEGVEKIIMVV